MTKMTTQKVCEVEECVLLKKEPASECYEIKVSAGQELWSSG